MYALYITILYEAEMISCIYLRHIGADYGTIACMWR